MIRGGGPGSIVDAAALKHTAIATQPRIRLVASATSILFEGDRLARGSAVAYPASHWAIRVLRLGLIRAATMLTLAAGLTCNLLAGELKCPETHVRATGEDSLLERGTRQAKAQALELAQLRAVEQTCRASVASGRMHVTTEFSESGSHVLLVRAAGRAVDTRVVSVRVLPPPPGSSDPLYARLEVEACIRVDCEPSSQRDPYFSLIAVEIMNPDNVAIHSLREGESVTLAVTPSKDAYLTILSIYRGADGAPVARLVYPNALSPTPRHVPAGTVFRYPDSVDSGASGVQLTAVVPLGLEISAEQLWVIATRNPWPAAQAARNEYPRPTRQPALEERSVDFWNRLVVEMPPSEITDQFVTFSIFRR